MFCSSIIPTVNRPSLTRAVQSILEQDFAPEEWEVIIVNDSGQPLRQADWQSSPRVRILETNRRERSIARNAGAAIARGEFLHFLDDDDWLMPGALKTFYDLARTTHAQWDYGGYEIVDNQGTVLQRIQPSIEGNIFSLLVCGEAIPLGASVIESQLFFRLGGFDPAFTSGEDRDLGRRLALACDVCGKNTVVTRFRIGPIDSTTDWSIVAENDRRGREKALFAPGASDRIRTSYDSGYWRGRLSRSLLASAFWNFRRQNYCLTASRAISSLTLAGPHLLDAQFWRGLTTGLQAAGTAPLGRTVGNQGIQA